jgi:hypothetical protein
VLRAARRSDVSGQHIHHIFDSQQVLEVLNDVSGHIGPILKAKQSENLVGVLGP